ncbi:carbohydrate ABC transporter permease [Salipaludibacillus aurantiacus]|uniref:N-acetylglucosamine transport system permease protein n=1 Tax=Salipaludibacillus aurantiacus TaxID=1601833 RepID=A0A1H9WYQ8_9BACI|nr:carbohydrate ABC transporter permease [Salipaludibacillus aurantiacus]SES38787.1 N-acetylglucosamine transport system permease protein [Salipaludibacillus aurantiacus]
MKIETNTSLTKTGPLKTALKRETKQPVSKRILIRLPLVLWSLAVLYPITWMIIGAFKSNAEIYANPWGLPAEFNFNNFIDSWQNYNIDTGVFNSLIVTVLGALLTLVLAIPTSYALERMVFRGSTLIFNLYISAMMIPMVLGWIPLFFLLMQFNLLDNIFGLTLVYAVSQLPFSIFVLTTFMSSIPRELEESAAIDGMSPYGVLLKIITPLSMSGIITVTIMNAIQFWNEYFMALIFLQSRENYTLGLAVDFIRREAEYTNAWGTLFASLTIAIIPVIILYAIFQRRITKGMTEGAIKG